MISCITIENLSEFGKTLHSSFKLRHEGFIERQNYDVYDYNNMEFDQYDTPAAAYLVYHDDSGVALGVSRLTPTSLSCMLRDIWPHLVKDKSFLCAPSIWEGTRYCIKKDLAPELRQKIIHEMAVAYLEFGLDHGLSKIIGMMPTYIYRSVFEKPGIRMEYLGDVEKIGRHNIRAVAIPVQQSELLNVRKKTGITNRVLRYTLQREVEGEDAYAKAA